LGLQSWFPFQDWKQIAQGREVSEACIGALSKVVIAQDQSSRARASIPQLVFTNLQSTYLVQT